MKEKYYDFNPANTFPLGKARKNRIFTIIVQTYCTLFVAGSITLLFSYVLTSSPRWVLGTYAAAFTLFCLLLFLLYIKQRKEPKAMLINELNETKSRIQQIQLQKRQEQLHALQSQINPHFLYNTLDTIRGLAIEKDSLDIANIVGALASMFKYSMDYSSPNVTVSDEMTYLGQFLKIQSMRFPEKFTVEEIFECECAMLLRVSVPKLTLQPIAENAISHGLRNVTSGGKITVRYILSDADFKIVISDNGTGIAENMVLALNRSFCTNNLDKEMQDSNQFGIALSNIDMRIKIYCGEQYGLFIASTPGLGTDVTVTLPAPETEA